MIQPTKNLVYKHNQQACHDLGGFLPEPRDERENQFLDILRPGTFVLGMTDKLQEGQWRWESDGTLVKWTSWMKFRTTSEPNGGTRQNCAIMSRKHWTHVEGHRTDGWVDYDCGSRLTRYHSRINLVCQRNSGMFTIFSSYVTS